MKKSSALSVSIISIILSISVLSGCGILTSKKDKVFSVAGLNITLTEQFSEKEYVGQTALFMSANSAVTMLKEEFSSVEGFEDYTLLKYTELVLSANNYDCEIVEKDGLTTFEFESKQNAKDYTYFACTYKASDAFWLLQFYCETKNYEETSADFIKWAKTVEFDD